MGHAASVADFEVPFELQYTGYARKYGVSRSVVSYAHKRFKQIKSTGLLEDSGDYLHISPEELRRGMLLGDKIAKALLLGLFDVHGNCGREGVMFEDYLSVMVSYVQASDLDKFSMLLACLFHLPAGTANAGFELTKDDFVETASAAGAMSESDASVLFDAVFEAQAGASVTWGSVCTYLYDNTPEKALQTMLELPEFISPS